MSRPWRREFSPSSDAHLRSCLNRPLSCELLEQRLCRRAPRAAFASRRAYSAAAYSVQRRTNVSQSCNSSAIAASAARPGLPELSLPAQDSARPRLTAAAAAWVSLSHISRSGTIRASMTRISVPSMFSTIPGRLAARPAAPESRRPYLLASATSQQADWSDPWAGLSWRYTLVIHGGQITKMPCSESVAHAETCRAQQRVSLREFRANRSIGCGDVRYGCEPYTLHSLWQMTHIG